VGLPADDSSAIARTSIGNQGEILLATTADNFPTIINGELHPRFNTISPFNPTQRISPTRLIEDRFPQRPEGLGYAIMTDAIGISLTDLDGRSDSERPPSLSLVG